MHVCVCVCVCGIARMAAQDHVEKEGGRKHCLVSPTRNEH